MASKLEILVVEDHHTLRDAMVGALAAAGFDAVGVMSAEELKHLSLKSPPDIYVLDLNLPGEDGLSLSARIREQHPDCGIVMLTARNLKQDRIQGYKSGADVYLMKPTDLDELLAAVESLAERVHRAKPEVEESARFQANLFFDRRELVGTAGKEVLSQREATVLVALSKSGLEPLPYTEIVELFGEDPDTYQKASLEVAMTRLRQKLEKVGCEVGCLSSVRGVGYVLKIRLSIQ